MKAFNSFVALGLFCLFGSSAALAQVSMNDVSILMPLPKSADDLKNNYLNASTALSTGALVSALRLKLFDWTGVQADLDLRTRSNIDRLAALGLRFDPCFKDQFSEACRPQIRLVLQPVVFTASASTAADVGIHLFFDTSQEQVIQLIRFAAEYRNRFLGASSAKAPLQVHPVISQESTSGKFWQAMRPMIQNVLNQATPSRIAFFVVSPNGRAWTLKSFDLKGNQGFSVPIAGITADIQHIDNQVQNSTIDFISTVLPRARAGTDQTFDFLTNSTQFRRTGNMQSLLMSADRLENPGSHLPGTIDCLSCHSTPAIKHLLRRNSIGLNGTVARFISTTLPQSSLINIFEDNYEANDFRLMGYRDAKPILGQRVINESASVVDGFSRNFILNLQKAQ